MNRDFFLLKQCYGPGAKLALQTNGSDPLEIYFGSEGCRYYKCNDVEIIPDKDTTVTIIVTLFGINDTNDNFNCIYTTKGPFKIYQRPDPKTYPEYTINFNITIGEQVISKPSMFEGSIKVQGSCTVTQETNMIVDC